ncbi:MAG TPA: GTPase HflX, partial [Kofleriaceae bacterium]|nr:GTPase HflX [Kofleriaceae bacterium]
MAEHVEGEARPRAVIAAVQLQGVDDGSFASSLAELRRLAITLGLDVVGMVTQRRGKLAPGKVLGDGKLRELAAWTGGSGVVEAYQRPGKRKKAADVEPDPELEDAEDDEDDDDDEPVAEPDAEDESETGETWELEQDREPQVETAAGADRPHGPPPGAPPVTVVVVDHDLSPTQQRNLERATDAEVMDRTSVILGIFHRHARTREARLQVEIARLGYLAPRLRELGGGGDRVRGGVGGKGAGESSLELDRRRIRDRIAELRRELAGIEGGSRTRRQRRGDVSTVAVVGYTNAGKSSLMRALTGSEVYVADKLFATLDTTVRVLDSRTRPPILISDTVGFIKKLPHDLVASFRSTLEEAAEGDLLLHVVDASDPAFVDQMAVTHEVLGEVGADAPSLVVLNKADRLDDEARADLALRYPDAVIMSAKDPADVARLHDRIVEHFAGAATEAELMIPWARHGLV